VDFFTRPPEFPGGLEAFYEYMGRKVKYTAYLQEIRVEGIVFVSFVVNLDGTVTEVEILRGLHPDLDEQVVEALKKSPHWSPGFQGRHAVPVRYKVPVRFTLGN
jgi:TonB family protein